MFNDKHTYIVDRIESNLVVCENNQGDFININMSRIDGKPKEGDVLVLIDNRYNIDIALTKTKAREIEDSMKGMWEE